MPRITESTVSVPYEITLLSNYEGTYSGRYVFQYLMKLHYSQTPTVIHFETVRFQYLMKLHYSQTKYFHKRGANTVSVPYEITLLSNSGLWSMI